MADFDTALMPQIFNVAERKRESNVYHDCQADKLKADFKVVEWGALYHHESLRDQPDHLKSNPAAKTQPAFGSHEFTTPTKDKHEC